MRKLLFIVFIYMSKICNAQQFPDYCVYLVKGEITYTQAGSKPQQLKQKQLLYKNEILVLSKNSEVTLINRDYKLLVLNSVGPIKVNGLEKKFNVSSVSVTKSYLDLAFHELLDPNYDYASFRQRNVGGIKGGVPRGNADDCDNPIFPIKDLKTSEDSICFKWHQLGSSNDFILTIYDSIAKEIVKIEVRDTQRIVNIAEVLHGDPGKYFWIVKDKAIGCQSNPTIFQFMNKQDEQKLITAHLVQKGTNDILSQLKIVNELEKDNWIYAAIKYFKTIVANNTSDNILLKSYVLFLLKYGFEEEAYAEWKKLNVKMSLKT